MAVDMWLVVSTPDAGVHLWCVGDADRPDLADLVAAARVSVGYPPADGIPFDGWSVHLAGGEPHPKLLAVAKVHDVADLDVAAAGKYRAQCDAQSRQARVDAVTTALKELDPASRADVLAAVAAVEVSARGAVLP